LVVPCAFSSHGCTQLLKLKEMRGHEAFHCQPRRSRARSRRAPTPRRPPFL
jgi:hypothetical protein